MLPISPVKSSSRSSLSLVLENNSQRLCDDVSFVIPQRTKFKFYISEESLFSCSRELFLVFLCPKFVTQVTKICAPRGAKKSEKVNFYTTPKEEKR